MSNWSYFLFIGAVIVVSAAVFVQQHGIPFSMGPSSHCSDLASSDAKSQSASIDDLDDCIDQCAECDTKSLGRLLFARGLKNADYRRYAAAADDFTRCIEGQYPLEQSLYLRGLCYIDLHQYVESRNDLESVAQWYRNVPYYHWNLSLAYIKLGLFDRAIESIDRAIALNGKKAAYWDRRAGIHEKMYQYRQAISDIDEAIRLAPSVKGYHCYRGYLNTKCGNLKQAIEDFHEELDLNPRSKYSHEMLARNYAKLGDSSRAGFHERKAERIE